MYLCTFTSYQVSGFSDDLFEDEEEDDGLILSREIEDCERREYGQIGVNVYAEYFRAGGLHFAAVFLALSLAMQCLKGTHFSDVCIT